ncbi:crAss001_48 related protein [Novosphingobium clariflavum]|uniref:Extradiol ring-cleavage dioxygenase LigAB LigA subunit domain-containing protein n=1 Tax=Novosphingobium clariflavum TaxID=2029884 RepID=A0ABV6S2B0_9SPHN|nr:hypothetical protein [Novosphingobium clariflavum]
MSKPHVQRMAAEHKELAERTLKLSAFLNNPVFADLAAEDKDLLHAQYAAMGAYKTILMIRLSRAQAEEKAA